jgi:ABC-type sugar transport system ATPase subunit
LCLARNHRRNRTAVQASSARYALSPDTRISNLRVAEMQMVEIAKAISCKSDLIIMDEPSSAITDREVARLFDLIRSLRAKGIAIVYITHKLDEVFRISDTVTVLRDGKHVRTQATKELSHDELIAMMVGREIGAYFPREYVQTGEVNFKVMNLSKKQKFDRVSFEARRGEILGIAGLVGAGRTEIAEAIIGLDPADSGEIFINGKRANIRRPFDAIRQGIAFVPDDRKLKVLNLQGQRWPQYDDRQLTALLQVQPSHHVGSRETGNREVDTSARHQNHERGDGAFIVHLIFKCLETLEAPPKIRSDTGALSGRWPW